MRINFNDYDLNEFHLIDGIFCFHPAKLIIPNDLGCNFTQKNSIFRSSIWDLDGNLLSASMKKFTNWLERPAEFPIPIDLNKCNLYNKIDGSTYIVDYVDGFINKRSRGTFSYITLSNAADWDYAWRKYPLIEGFIKEYKQLSLIFEIVCKSQRIVINYGDETDLYLIGAIYKDNYELMTQACLDEISKQINVKRPAKYQYPSFEKMLDIVKEDQQNEGICVYSPDTNGLPDQFIHKCKAQKYILLHKLRSQLASLDKVIDLYLVQHRPTFDNLYGFVFKTFDFEIAEISKENIKKCCELGVLAQKSLDEISQFVSTLDKSSRKDCALKIIDKYREKSLDSFAFSILNGKKIEDKDFKRLMENLNK